MAKHLPQAWHEELQTPDPAAARAAETAARALDEDERIADEMAAARRRIRGRDEALGRLAGVVPEAARSLPDSLPGQVKEEVVAALGHYTRCYAGQYCI